MSACLPKLALVLLLIYIRPRRPQEAAELSSGRMLRTALLLLLLCVLPSWSYVLSVPRSDLTGVASAASLDTEAKWIFFGTCF